MLATYKKYYHRLTSGNIWAEKEFPNEREHRENHCDSDQEVEEKSRGEVQAHLTEHTNT